MSFPHTGLVLNGGLVGCGGFFIFWGGGKDVRQLPEVAILYYVGFGLGN